MPRGLPNDVRLATGVETVTAGRLLEHRTLRDALPATAAWSRGQGTTTVSLMAYDEDLAHRIRERLADQAGVTEKAMFGGLAFLLGGITKTGELMVRVGPDATDEALAKPHTRLFDMTGRPMTGWILVEREGFKTTRQLGAWVSRGVAFAGSLPPKG